MNQMTYISMPTISPKVLTTLYQSINWLAYTKNTQVMEKILPQSLWYMAAYDQDKLIGLIRVVGDDCSIAYVQDILVDPAYQRQGIGRELFKKMLRRFSHVRQLVLITDNEQKTKSFYTAMGLKTVEEVEGVCFIRYSY